MESRSEKLFYLRVIEKRANFLSKMFYVKTEKFIFLLNKFSPVIFKT